MRFLKWLMVLGMTLSFPLGSLAALDLGADGLASAGTGAGISTTGSQASLGSMIGLIVTSLLNILGVLLFIYFLYAGFLWMTAQGDEKRVTKAKDIMKNSVAGLLLVLGAFSLTFFMLENLPGGSSLDAGILSDAMSEGASGGASLYLAENIGSLIKAGLNIIGVILFVVFLYAGFLWMTAQGDEKQVKKAKDMMGNAVAGLVIILIANSMVFFLAAELPGGSSIWTESTSDVNTAAGLGGTELVLENNIGTLITVVLNFLGVIMLLIFLYAGFLWMTAQGDEKQVKKAKDMMRNAVVGFVLILVSRVIATFLIDTLAPPQTISLAPEAIAIHKRQV